MYCIHSKIFLGVLVLNVVHGAVLFSRTFKNSGNNNNINNRAVGKNVESEKNNCTCIPAYFCADDENAEVLGEGLLDIRSSGRSACPNYFEICCERPMEHIPSKNDMLKGCGYKNENGVVARITSQSEDTLFGELPWTIAILLKSTPDAHAFQCGGSLIHPQVVLTTAHCVYQTDPKELLIRAGEWDTRTKNEAVSHQDVYVQEVVTHQHYNAKSLKNDVALLFLIKEVILLDNVGLICLPPQGLNVDNIQCTVSGWGKNAFKKGQYSSILKKVDLPIIEKTQCQEALRKTRLGPFYNLHDSFVCAGGEKNKDTCKGDGGSPLVCPILNADGSKNGRYFQMGMVSWGIGCGDETPAVYTNVPMFTDWIDAQLVSRNLDNIVYKY